MPVAVSRACSMTRSISTISSPSGVSGILVNHLGGRLSAAKPSCTVPSISTDKFKKAYGILSGLWEKVRETPDLFLDHRTLERDGLDVAAKDFLAGMTDRFAITLFEELFVPRPWGR